MRQELNNKTGSEAANIRKMMENNEASNALLNQAAARLDAATNALMIEKAEFASAKQQLLEKGTEFASINAELEKTMAAVDDLVAFQCDKFANYDNPPTLTPTSSVCSGMGIFDPHEFASVQTELQKEKDELDALKIALKDAFKDIRLGDEEPERIPNGIKGDDKYGPKHKINEFNKPITKGTVDTRAEDREDLKASIIEELKETLKADIKAELSAQLKKKLRNKVTDLKVDLMCQLKNDIMFEIRMDPLDVLKNELKDELKEDLIEHVNSNIKHEFIKHEIKDAVSHEMADCIKPRFLSAIYDDMRDALHRIDAKEEELQNTLDHAILSFDAKSKKLDDKMASRIDEKLRAGSFQGWNDTYTKALREKKRHEPFAQNAAHANFPMKIDGVCCFDTSTAADTSESTEDKFWAPGWDTKPRHAFSTMNAPFQKASVPFPEVPAPKAFRESFMKSEGSIVSRCVASNACDSEPFGGTKRSAFWGDWDEPPASEVEGKGSWHDDDGWGKASAAETELEARSDRWF
ncbi:hypothetical protein LX32DRAFT_688797 [Colletotrichum zoysiae]|uniref:Uncharacterized protein n=1 Tax=Colletotrichum zoysiae TaxID=1216348 RepID=A0AAD9HW63_9PEZI|nr:hypothetical protein LX32DRAFT_688797 [Colletotrichum zoysiae]